MFLSSGAISLEHLLKQKQLAKVTTCPSTAPVGWPHDSVNYCMPRPTTPCSCTALPRRARPIALEQSLTGVAQRREVTQQTTSGASRRAAPYCTARRSRAGSLAGMPRPAPSTMESRQSSAAGHAATKAVAMTYGYVLVPPPVDLPRPNFSGVAPAIGEVAVSSLSARGDR